VPAPVYPEIKPVMGIDALKEIKIANTTIESVAQNADGSIRVTAIVTHPPANDRVQVFIGLPANWNGRFQGTGGGGWSGGSAFGVNGPVGQGYAAGATDTGHPGASGSFGLDKEGRSDMQAIVDNAYQGIHDMTVVGKAITTAYYGKAPKYSYFTGFSTGGRQGLAEAQRFPEDYDGVVAGCPAINWHKMVVSSLWPQVVMNAAGDRVPVAKLRAVTQAFVAACDGMDGVKDGLVENPSQCAFDLKSLVGTEVGGSPFTAKDAELIGKMWEGARAADGSFLWYGMAKGADLTALGGPQPLSIGIEYIRYFLVKDPKWDISQMTPAEFERLFKKSGEEWGPVFGTDNPDLTKFRDHGGKVIIMHGQADQLIMTEGTIDYYKRVTEKMGGREKTMEFARLFLIPGAGHGNGGVGNGALDAVVKWVEEGTAPGILINRTQNRTRPLYPYPELAKYKGTGSTDEAGNFESTMPK
jgi:feruloyl esterase